eukprot:CAMPEP_0183294890 /NCGR_PEP_ID=MMETSP0160_2-20130417/3038_1 /TAXON_ID=2839 ORGANISM="Odontella Sinensis, Strain Grunow 1884" /NCGR_SAMPLE_ID=MMETSP0160_2 /ASSEMBLY_ACC=CAM_ASM_000250 /LENGTH=350 /DNA_ID=CAMNT_0025456275 /DNA_START=82 /DNA_END=1131 /DNA_ORIENTATION=+
MHFIADLAVLLILVTAASGATCPSDFDPESLPKQNRLASYHNEYMLPYEPYVVNCDGMDAFTLGQGDDLVAAIENDRYAGGERCGTCAYVTGPKGSTIVKIIDRCVDCSDLGRALDLSPRAFKEINGGSLVEGVIPVTWETVSCPSERVQPHLSYRFKQGSTKWWIQLQVLYNIDPIQKVEVFSGNQYYEMRPTMHSFWELVQTPLPLRETHLKVRITSTAGEILEDKIPELKFEQADVQAGSKKVQFSGGCEASGSSNLDKSLSQAPSPATTPVPKPAPKPTSKPTSKPTPKPTPKPAPSSMPSSFPSLSPSSRPSSKPSPTALRGSSPTGTGGGCSCVATDPRVSDSW